MAEIDPRTRRLAALDCCAVSDALDKLGLPGVVTGLARLSTTRRIAGRAVTVKLGKGPAPSNGAVRHLGTSAVEAASAGHVIVIEQRSGIDAGSWGGILSLGAKLRGVEGIVADGPVRDIDEAMAQDFPIFARGCTSRTARGRIVEHSTNAPITVGDVAVSAADWVLADGSAVVFIAAAEIDRVLTVAEEIVTREALMTKALRDGQPITEVMDADYEHMLKR